MPGVDSPLHVAVDATPLLGARTGVGVFTHALLRGLGNRADVDVTAFPISVSGRRHLRDALPPGVDARTPPLPARPLHAVWRRASRPRLDLLLGRPDVVHGPNFVVPPARAARVATVHDLTTLRFPELCHPATLAFPTLVRRAAAEGAWVHTPSHAVRDEVLEELRLDPDRVVAVPNGFDRPAGDAEVGRRLAGAERYVLAVGTVEPRKDLPSLVRAVDQIAAAHPDLVLVHAGGDGWGVEDLDTAMAALRHPERVRRLGHVAHPQLGHLYAGASVFAYPSVYEGFGIPVLEAMSSGVPVVCTDVPAVREVAGDAAAIVPVGDVDGLAGAIARAWTDDAWRASAVGRGAARAERYSWDACVAGLVGVYHAALAGSGPAGHPA
ncbi:MAG TPA: glycosyltransferase family 1 protein [Acidimicrobiales bacterium]|nr:glycosyltransferase family 1 protein [Acidimicrobiales bacterium]